VSSSDLSSCEINASTPPSASTDALAGVNINNRKTKIEPVGDSPTTATTQYYSVTNFTAPGFATGNAASNNSSICDNTASAAKFENLLGGSATLEVTGTVSRNGREAAKYVLKRTVHIRFPNQAISTPIALLGRGSKLQYLNGRICQSDDPAPNTCGKKPNNPTAPHRLCRPRDS